MTSGNVGTPVCHGSSRPPHLGENNAGDPFREACGWVVIWTLIFCFLLSDVHGALIAALNRRGKDGKAYSPWFFPSDVHYKAMLEEQGFEVQTISLNPRPTELPTNIAGWIETFGFTFLAALESDEERRAMVQEIAEEMKVTHQREDGKWFIMYNRCRFIAYKRTI